MKMYPGKMKRIGLTTTLLGMFVTFTHASPVINQMGFNTTLKPEISSKGFLVHPVSLGNPPGIYVMQASDAKRKQNGKCVYDMAYHTKNVGKSTASKHINVFRRNGKIVKRHPQNELKVGQSKSFKFEIALFEGINTLQMSQDDGNMVNEIHENNNTLIKTIRVDGSCMSLTSQVGGRPKPVAKQKK